MLGWQHGQKLFNQPDEARRKQRTSVAALRNAAKGGRPPG
jgi:hypothetical protein